MLVSAKTLTAFLSGVGLTYGTILLLSERPLQLSVNAYQLESNIRQILGLAPEPKVLEQEQRANLALSASKQSVQSLPETPADPVAEFTVLLEQEEYEQAFDFYEQQLKLGTEQKYFRPIYLHLLERLQKAPASANVLIEQLLALDYGNSDLHYLALATNYQLARYAQAMEHLIYMRDAYVPERLIERVENQQRTLLKDYIQELEKSGDIEAIDVLIGQLQYLNEAEAAAQLQQLLTQLEKLNQLASLYPTQIQMTPMGQHHLVEVTLNDSVRLDLILDTGASYVSVSESALAQVQYELKRQGVTFNTANGQSQGDIVVVDSFRVGDIELTNFELSTLSNYSTQNNAGLLGQGFLSLFDWQLDQNNHVLYLAPKSTN